MTEQEKKVVENQQEAVYRFYMQSFVPKQSLSQTAYEAQGLQKLLSEGRS